MFNLINNWLIWVRIWHFTWWERERERERERSDIIFGGGGVVVIVGDLSNMGGDEGCLSPLRCKGDDFWFGWTKENGRWVLYMGKIVI